MLADYMTLSVCACGAQLPTVEAIEDRLAAALRAYESAHTADTISNACGWLGSAVKGVLANLRGQCARCQGTNLGYCRNCGCTNQAPVPNACRLCGGAIGNSQRTTQKGIDQ